MRTGLKPFFFAPLVITLLSPSAAWSSQYGQAGNALAGVVQVNAALSSGHYLRGLTLATDGLAASISADWSADNGLFAGGECFQGDSTRFEALDNACIGYFGYFQTLSSSHAFALEGRRYNYGSGDAIDWDTTEFSVSWHYQDSLLVALSYSDEWLGRGSATTALDVSYRLSLSDSLTVIADVGVLEPSTKGRIDTLSNVGVGLEYQAGRWNTSIKASAVDTRTRENMPFDISQPELLWSVSYQLY